MAILDDLDFADRVLKTLHMGPPAPAPEAGRDQEARQAAGAGRCDQPRPARGRPQIEEYVAEKTDWNVAPKTLDGYIAAAEARFREAANVQRELEAGRALMRLNDLYARCMKAQDYKTCLAVQREINGLLDLRQSD